MNFKNLRWAPVGAAFALFAAVDLLVLFLTPGPNRGIALLPPTLAGLVVLLTLPSLLALFDKQQESIEHQKRQLTTLHAMDTAIAAELELPSLLQVAAEKATQALDGEWGGIALVDERGQVEAEAFHNLSAEDAAAGRDLLRRGGGNDAWEVARVPVHRGEDFLGFLVVAKRRPGTTFSADAIALLRDLAGTIVVAVKNAHALAAARHLAEVERALVRERRIAEALQEGLLPEMPEEDGPFLFSRLYQAQSDEAQVGGDIYDLFPLDGGGRWGVLIADVSGKGLKAAQKTAGTGEIRLTLVCPRAHQPRRCGDAFKRYAVR